MKQIQNITESFVENDWINEDIFNKRPQTWMESWFNIHIFWKNNNNKKKCFIYKETLS